VIRIADDLYTWRRTYRLSQRDAADLLNVSVRTVGRWERGDSTPAEDHYNTLRWIISQPPVGWIR
jgi:DNA-binding transcriptional regulator YiaG